jgi:membrane-bound lytic murein transglycosylase D
MQTMGNRAGYLWLAAALGVCLAAGCDDASRNVAQARAPEIRPAVAAPQSLAPKTDLGNLPLQPRSYALLALTPAPPSGADEIMAYAKARFGAGQQAFDAGDFPSAGAQFDAAVSAMLASGLDLEHDAKWGALFNQIVDTVTSDELAASIVEKNPTEQKTETAPLDEIPEELPPAELSAYPSLAASAEAELANVPHDLPLTVNDYVLAYLRFFQTPRGRAIVETGLRRAGRYRPMIERVLREEGLPQDLIYMAQAESAFQPAAVSRQRAVGLWQFVADRAREYGLHRTWWIDERQDPEKATHAAARHLRDLYEQFNDWYLAMAAYDTGPGNVQRAIEHTGYADFWELYRRNALLPETKNYVPIILAMALVAKDPQRYGIEVTPDPFIETDIVQPGHAIDLRLVAESIDVDVETLRGLNPELLRMVTPADPQYALRLPTGTGERFQEEIAGIPPEKWLSWRKHRVEQGETLGEIARKYHVTEAELAEVNGIEPRFEPETGEKLIIPSAARSDVPLGKLLRYRVQRGDTIFSIAEQFSVSAAEIAKWNHLSAEHVSRGMVLRVYPGGMQPPPSMAQHHGSKTVTATASKAAAPAVASRTTVVANQSSHSSAQKSAPITHKVQAGETLWSIARAYRTTAEALKSANRFLFTRQLRVGDELVIFPAH